jgi:hypothetical protein
MSTSHRRFGGPVLILVALTFTTMASLATSAQAAPYAHAATIALGSQVACASESVRGSGFTAGSVALSLQSGTASLSSVTADANGNFSTTVALPSGIDGTHTIVAAQGGVTATVGVTIDCGGSGAGGVNVGTGTGGSGTGGSGTSGGLSNTGVAVIGIGSLGVILLIGGGVLLLAGRRHRVSA